MVCEVRFRRPKGSRRKSSFLDARPLRKGVKGLANVKLKKVPKQAWALVDGPLKKKNFFAASLTALTFLLF